VDEYRIECPGWSFAPVLVARSFLDRLWGAAAIPPAAALVIPGRSVHGMWGAPMTVVALDRDLAVLGVRALGRGGAVTFGRAHRLLELPVGSLPPPVGARLVLVGAGRSRGLRMLADVSGHLVLCATPIGNLGDVPPRLVDTLAGADVILAEDTRRTRALLNAIGVDRPLVSFFAGNERQRQADVRQRLGRGERIALVTDAGTPAVSDPGSAAVEAARQAGATVSIVPGPSAVTGAVAVSGFGADRFVFEGFLPRKGRERRSRLAGLATEQRTSVLFLSPHRILEDLDALADVAGPGREVCIVRELTKLHEEVAWFTLAGAIEEWEDREPIGEYTLVIRGAAPPVPDLDEAVSRARELMAAGEPRSASAKQAAAETGVNRRDVYDALGG
jgi:16S rRNA (cytidine1402-2'-O)-methyltransferase